MGTMASPSPTSRAQFVSPVNKNRMVPLGQNPPSSPVSNFQHPALSNRPLQVQMQQQRQLSSQQRLNQSPFSPQSQPPQSPHDMLPGSPASQTGLDPFARPPSEGMPDSYIHHSPQTPRSVGHQSPVPTPNRSPAYSGQPIPNTQTAMRINLDTPYSQAPGTPRPQFPGGQARPTVYARPGDLFGPSQNSPFTSPRSDGFNQPAQEGNRQLRDLLQRQQMPAPGAGQVIVQNQQTQQSPQSMQPLSPFMDDQQTAGQSLQIQQQIQQQQQAQQVPGQQVQSAPTDQVTFRQPLPPNMMTRPRLQIPGAVIRAPGGNVVSIPGTGPNGPVMVKQQIVRTGGTGQMVITQQNIVQQQQLMRQRMQLPLRPEGGFVGQMPQSAQMISQQQTQHPIGQGALTSQTDQHNIALLAQRLAGEGEAHASPSTTPAGASVVQPGGTMAQPNAPSQSQPGPEGASEIPDSVSAELEKLEQEDNTGIGEVEGVGDILGGLGDDDDELLDSLTAEMGADFNILEYADPELDTTDGEKSNLLDSLELDEPEGDKSEDKTKTASENQINKSETSVKPDDANKSVAECSVSTALTQSSLMTNPPTIATQQQQLTAAIIQGQQTIVSTQQQQLQPMQQQQHMALQQQQQQAQTVGHQQSTQLQQLIAGQQMTTQQQAPTQQLQQQLIAGQMKAIRPNMLTPAHLQQIQQQMQQQVS